MLARGDGLDCHVLTYLNLARETETAQAISLFKSDTDITLSVPERLNLAVIQRVVSRCYTDSEGCIGTPHYCVWGQTSVMLLI